MVKSISSRAKKKFQVPLTKASSSNFYQRICGFSSKESLLCTFYLEIVSIKDRKSFYLNHIYAVETHLLLVY